MQACRSRIYLLKIMAGMRSTWPVLLVGLLISNFSTTVYAANSSTVYYPRPETQDDQRTNYPLRLLSLALEKTANDIVLKPTEKVMNQARALLQLEKGSQVDVVWSMTSIERENKLMPIRIPIYKGLIGWRIFLIHQDDVALFASIQGVEELKIKRALQGSDWPDRTILEANDFTVSHTPIYENLFKMLTLKRGDYFPRSIVEIWSEADRYHKDKIVIEKTHLIQYPTVFYFFVNTNRPNLAEVISEGLERAINDGSFDALFLEVHQNIIDRVDLAGRRIITLDNPTLPLATPLDREVLWFRVK